MQDSIQRFIIRNKWGAMPEHKYRGSNNNWLRVPNGSTETADETSLAGSLSTPSSVTGSSVKTDNIPPECKLGEHIKLEPNDAVPSIDGDLQEVGKYNFELLPEHNVQEQQGSKCFRCNICCATYRHAFSLKRHFLRTHVSPIYISTSDISNCNINLSVQEELARDEFQERARKSSTLIPMIGLYRCSTCTDQFNELDQLKNHVLNHPNTQSSKRFPCPQCTMTFSHKQNLVRHMSVHSGEKPYTCKYCGKGFPTATNQRRHERIHEGHKPYLCPHCASQFSQSGDLKKHIRKLHREFFHPCAFCLKYFAKEDDLREHVHSHGKSLELNSKVLKRKLLNNTISRLVVLEAPKPPISNGHHLDTTVLHDESRLQCNICKKHFSTRTNLRRHQRMVHSHSNPIQSNRGPIAQKLAETSQLQQLSNGTNGSKCLLTPSKYFASVSQNIAQNLQHHVDGKLSKTQQKHLPTNDENLAEVTLTTITKDSLFKKIEWRNYNFPPDYTGMEAVKLVAFKKEFGLVTKELGDCKQTRSLSTYNGIIEEENNSDEISCENDIDDDSLEVLDLSMSTKGIPVVKNQPDKLGPIMLFICHACGERYFSLNDIEEHKVNNHPNVYCTHLEIEGTKNAPAEMFHYRCSPVGVLQLCPVPPLTIASTMAQLHCTKCQEPFQTSVDLHKHILACGGYIEKTAKRGLKRRMPYAKINRGMKRQRDNGPVKPMKMMIEKAKTRSEPLLDFRFEVAIEKAPETSKPTDAEVNLMCDGCNRKFTYSSVLERHQKTCLSNLTAVVRADALNDARKQHSCMYCLRSFTYVASLKKHMTEFCPNKTTAKKKLDLKKARAKQVALTASKKKIHMKRKRKRFPFYKRKPTLPKPGTSNIPSNNDEEQIEDAHVSSSPGNSNSPKKITEPVASQLQKDGTKSPKRMAEQVASPVESSNMKDKMRPLSSKSDGVLVKACKDDMNEDKLHQESKLDQPPALKIPEPLPKIEPGTLPNVKKPEPLALMNEEDVKPVPIEVSKKPKREITVKVETDYTALLKRDNAQTHTCPKCKRTFTYLANFKKHLIDLCPLRSMENKEKESQDSRPAVQVMTQEEEEEKEEDSLMPAHGSSDSKSVPKETQLSAIGNKMTGLNVTMLKHRLSDMLKTPESSSQAGKLRTYGSEPSIRVRAQESIPEEKKWPLGWYRGKRRRAPMSRYQRRFYESGSSAQCSLVSGGASSNKEDDEKLEEIGSKDTCSAESGSTAKTQKSSLKDIKQSPVGDNTPSIKKEHISKYRKTIQRKVKESTTSSSKVSTNLSATYDSDTDLENEVE